MLYDDLWEPGRPHDAACPHGHHAPSLECACGIYAAREPEDALVYLTGRDEPVRDYVLSQPGAVDFVDGYARLLELVSEGYQREGKRFATIAVGCTGGKHRSVAIAEGRLDGSAFEDQRPVDAKGQALGVVMRRVGLVLFLWLSSAAVALAADATPLTPADVRYLKTLGQSQEDLAANQPTPAMLEKLHQLINDPATANKPKARSDAVYRQLDHIQAQFIWCSDHPTDKDCGGDKTAATQ